MSVSPDLLLGLLCAVCALVVFAGGAIWKLSRVELGLREAITRAREEIDAKVDTSRHDFSAAMEILRREVGEMGAALRQKIVEVEIWARDTFVRRDGFYNVRDELKADIRSLREDMKKSFDRMEIKIDNKKKESDHEKT